MEGRRPKNLTGDRIPVCQTELGSLNTPGKQGKWQHPDYVGELGWKDVQEKLLRQIKVTVLKTGEGRDKEVRERKVKALIKKGTKRFIRPPRSKEKLIKELEKKTQI
jgi:hypothetical protein